MIYTSDHITKLESYQVFVFGSNLKGMHGGGAAKLAMKFGAVRGIGVGHQGQTYAIPTKKDFETTLSIEEIKPYVDEFIEYAKNNYDVDFLVTKIGCGLAGHSVEDIAPLFEKAADRHNIILPEDFVKIFPKDPVVNFDGGYGREGTITFGNICECAHCKSEKVMGISVDGSDGEYAPGEICFDCIDKIKQQLNICPKT